MFCEKSAMLFCEKSLLFCDTAVSFPFMSKNYHIAILMGQDIGYCRDVLKGIQTYAAGQADWVFRDGPADIRVIKVLRDWKPDGSLRISMIERSPGV